MPFFRRRWDEAGVGPGDIHSLADLDAFPTYTVDDIRRSIEADPDYTRRPEPEDTLEVLRGLR